jgi:YD repeat-containing protein
MSAEGHFGCVERPPRKSDGRGHVLLYCAAALAGGLAAGQARAGTASVTYSYDPVGRVATALYDNGTCVAYTYDANGNRTSQTNTASGGGAQTPTWGTGTWRCFLWTSLPTSLELRPGGPMPPVLAEIWRASRAWALNGSYGANALLAAAEAAPSAVEGEAAR